MNKENLGIWLCSLGFVAEHPFKGRSGKRRFRFDWALPVHFLAVEYDGRGVGHQSISGTWADAEKSNEAALCGWVLVRCNVQTARDGRCQEWIEEAIQQRRDAA